MGYGPATHLFGGGKSMPVYCRMLESTIPEDVCRREQNASTCRGCSAPTRRCLDCRRVGIIAFPLLGLCSRCGDKRGVTHDRLDVDACGGSDADAIERLTASLLS